jgi:WD40 repeat protein
MSSLFGRSSSAPSASPSTGELANDVTLTSPPEDSISDLAWSPKTNFLAVASWDSKVRIYDVTQNSAGEGMAVINFDGPVLGCHWSKVCPVLTNSTTPHSNRRVNRTVNKWQVQVQTSQLNSSTSPRMVLPSSKSPHTMHPSDVFDSLNFRLPMLRCSSRAPGTKQSITGTSDSLLPWQLSPVRKRCVILASVISPNPGQVKGKS